VASSWPTRHPTGVTRRPRPPRQWPVPFASSTAAERFFAERYGSETSAQAWARVASPALVVRGGNGYVDPETARAMATRLPGARLVELPGAAHDLHLDRPDQWRVALSAFLATLGDDPGERPRRGS